MKRVFLSSLIALIIVIFTGCSNNVQPQNSSTNIEVNNINPTPASVDAVVLDNINYDLQIDFIYQNYSVERIELNTTCENADYFVITINDAIYTSTQSQIFISANFANVLIPTLTIRAYDWSDHLLASNEYHNLLLFNPQTASLADFSSIADDIRHLWILYGDLVNLASLSEFRALQTLVLSNSDYENFNPNDIGQLSNLRYLDASCALNRIDFLSNLHNLTFLSIRLDDAFVYHDIEELRALKHLVLFSNTATDMQLVNSFPCLESLNIFMPNLQTFPDLSALPLLHTLILTRVDNLDASGFASVAPQIKTLGIGEVSCSDWSFLKNFSKLQVLYANGIDTDNWSFLKELTNLEALYLAGNQYFVFEEHAQYLSGLTNLKLLDFGIYKEDGYLYSPHEPYDLSVLVPLCNLESLTLDVGKTKDLSIIANLENLTSLSLGGVSDLSDFENRLNNLQSLELRYISIDDFSAVADKLSLKNLYIYENYTQALSTDELYYDYFDYDFISSLVNLRSLSLNNFEWFYKIKDDHFPDLSKLKDLRFLMIDSLICPDLSGAFRAPNLECLELYECEFLNPPSLDGLTGLKTFIATDCKIGDEDWETQQYIWR